MATIVDQIKERIDIVDLIASYLKLQKSGVNYKARCPFHNEKTGSFFVSPERQIWHCFGCSLGGDAFGFIKQIEVVEFPEALRILARRAGIELRSPHGDARRAGDSEWESAKTRLLDITELAVRFFEKQLHSSSSGGQALAYLRERGLTDESIKKFRLGWAPDSWNSLIDFLRTRYNEHDVLNAGLVIKKDSGGYYDRFRSRIMFPIFDLNGQPVGFSARILELSQVPSRKPDIEPAKYVNTPQTAIYDKSRILYGMHAARLEIRRHDRCLVVEGNMDVIMSHQAGVAYAVASSGTALTAGHLKIIKRYTDNLDLCFDADSAGEIATRRGVDLALAGGFNVGVLAMGRPVSNAEPAILKDPADYVKINGAKWIEYVGGSEPFMKFFFNAAKDTYDVATALGKKLFAGNVLPLLASMANKIEQAHWVNEMALVLKTREDLIYGELAAVKPAAARLPDSQNERTDGNISVSADDKVKLDPVEETLLSLCIKKPDLAQQLSDDARGLLSDNFKKLSEKVAAAGSRVADQAVDAAVSADGLGMSLGFAYLKSQELWNGFDDHILAEEFSKILDQIKRRKITSLLANLEYDIKTAEKARDKDKLRALLAEFSQTSKKLPG